MAWGAQLRIEVGDDGAATAMAMVVGGCPGEAFTCAGLGRDSERHGGGQRHGSGGGQRDRARPQRSTGDVDGGGDGRRARGGLGVLDVSGEERRARLKCS